MGETTVRDETADPTATGRRHVHLERVRFADLDPLNHVNNVRMLTYLEDARFAFLHWDNEDGASAFGNLVVARHEADYLRPLTMRRAPFRVETWVTEVRNASFTLRYEIVDDEAVYLRALSVLVAYDLSEQRPRRLNSRERAHLRRYLVD